MYVLLCMTQGHLGLDYIALDNIRTTFRNNVTFATFIGTYFDFVSDVITTCIPLVLISLCIPDIPSDKFN